MEVELTPRGWFARSDGLASRGRTREEAVRRQQDIVALVRRLAQKWEENRAQKTSWRPLEEWSR